MMGEFFSPFSGEKTMKQSTSKIYRTEQAIFNLIRSVNELCALQNELTFQDMDQIEQELVLLHSSLQRKRELARWAFPCVV